MGSMVQSSFSASADVPKMPALQDTLISNEDDKKKSNTNGTANYLRFCKPVAIIVLFISIGLLIYVLYTSYQNYGTKTVAGVQIQEAAQQGQQGQYMQAMPVGGVMPQPYGAYGGKSRGKSKANGPLKKVLKNANKVVKKAMGKMRMKGGSAQCGGNTCGCIVNPK
jgi:hypothetical protein